MWELMQDMSKKEKTFLFHHRRYDHWFWHKGVFGWFWNKVEKYSSKFNNWIWRKRWAKRP